MKKVPRLRFRGFSEDWELCKLGRIFDVHTDFVSNGSFQSLKNNVRFYNDENYAYMIRLQDASNNWRGPWLYTDKHGFDFLKKSTVYENDILMSDRGTIGKFFLVPKLDRPMTLSSNAVLLRSSNCNNNFIYYMLNTIDIGNQIKKRTTPGVQPMISKTEFKKIITKLPVREEQKKIGDFLKKIDETFTLHQRKLDQLKKLKKAYLQEMFVSINTKNNKVPKLRFANFEGNWELCKLENIIEKQIKGKAKVENLCNGSVEYLDANRLNGGKPIYTKALPDVSERDIIILWDGSKAGKVYYGFKGVLGSTLKAYQLKECANSQFIYQQLLDNQNNIYNNYRTPNIPHVVKNFSSIFPIWMTSFEEQSQMADILSNLDNRIILQQNLTDTMISLKKSYLQNMFI
ncbi:restriction endonuclease subunit S [Enterococcus faecalis]|nr:restriction endonuclease subunit S [Enterococcus faecalis]EIA6914216.1 restriction endonuclease subunit S [Enterococcus faecalis]